MSLLSKLKPGFTSHSMLVKLMISFLSVILLLAAFNAFTYLYMRNKLYDEIVRYNELGIKQTVENYENHFRLTQNMILSLTQSDRWKANISILSDVVNNRRYDKINEVKGDLYEMYSNPFLHFDNFILYFKESGYVLEKDGTSRMEDMFGSYYASEAYSPSYWSRYTADNYVMRILPAAFFTERTMNNVRSLGLQLPVVIKAAPYKEVYAIIMMNPRKLNTAYANTGEPFYILDEEGRTLYTSHPFVEVRRPASYEGGKRHERSGGHYYFYEQGSVTGFTYVRVAPIKSIMAEMMKLNILLITLLSAAVLFSIFGSAMFSLRLNHPLKRIIDLLERKQQPVPMPASSIKEFAIISDKMSSMMNANERILKDLEKKNSLVRQFAYTNKVKNIPMNLNLAELEDAVQTNEPYAAVLYEIGFKNTDSEYDEEIQLLRKLIHGLFAGLGEEPVTLQIEHNQLISLLFQPGSMNEVHRVLNLLKELLQAEDYLCLTIAVSPIYPEDTPITQAYEQLLQLLKEKRLTGDTQIIVEPRAPGTRALPMKVAQREELLARLLSGNEEAVLEWIERHLEQFIKQDVPAADFMAYARGIAEQVEKALAQSNVHDSAVGGRLHDYDVLAQFYSAEQYKQWFRDLIRPAVQAIKARTENKDPIASFVTEYLNNHLQEDINLDLVADKLNITPGYLSTYFKEKTGTNFSDYLNDLRISRARELLMNLELRIQDVASEVGYHNVNSFIRMFKRYTGITPGEYRKRTI